MICGIRGVINNLILPELHQKRNRKCIIIDLSFLCNAVITIIILLNRKRFSENNIFK